MRKKYGFPMLGAADGPTKTAIFGGNNARLYGVTAQHRASLVNDRFALAKQAYDLEGGNRTNMAYGYAIKST